MSEVIGRVWNNDPSSAGLCHECGEYVERRYGGEGRHFAYCLDCWLGGHHELTDHTAEGAASTAPSNAESMAPSRRTEESDAWPP